MMKCKQVTTMMMKINTNEASRIKQHPGNEKTCTWNYDKTLGTSILIVTGSFLSYYPPNANFGSQSKTLELILGTNRFGQLRKSSRRASRYTLN